MAKRINEAGFTLIELLVVISIIAILAAMGMLSFKQLRYRASYAASQESMHLARVALAAGISGQSNPTMPVVVSQFTPGGISTAAGRNLLPGFKVPERTQFFVLYNPLCTAGVCFREYIRVRNCNTTRYSYFARLGNGAEMLIGNINAGGTC